MLRKLSIVVRILIAAAGVAYIVYSINWRDVTDAQAAVQEPGVWTMLRGANVLLLVIGLFIMVIVYPLQALRWWLLMGARRIDAGYGRALRLYMVGSFFNFCMPGTTGGDVVKGYYAARHSDRRTDALMSILFDRITGMIGLFLFAGVVALVMLDHPLVRKLAMCSWAALLVVVVGYGCYSSRLLRRLLHIEKTRNWPVIGKFVAIIDDAALAYRDHLGSVGVAIMISALAHFLLALALALAGLALGVSAPIQLLMGINPAIVFVGALPISYQGVGVQEGVAQAMIADHATMNQIVGMLMFFRLYMLVYALCGSLFLIGGDIHMRPPSESN